MMKNLCFTMFSAIALASLLVPASSRAIRVAVGETGVLPGTSGNGTITSTVIWPDDNDTSDDDIVQLNNLVISGISSAGLPAEITVSSDVGQRCFKFEEPTSSTGVSFPCPAMPSSLYRIRVDTNSILLLRTRARATLTDFAVGNRINVYGFMDRDTSVIEALILRNLDKPVQIRYVQLNNLEVLVAPDANTPPASFVAVQRFVTPCYDFGVGGTGMKAEITCPLGAEQAEPSRSNQTPPGPPTTPSGSSPSSFGDYYPPLRKYRVSVNTATLVVDRSRILIPLTAIGVGDRVNVYGTIDANGNISAVIVRNLSKPASQRVSIDSMDPSSGTVGTVVTLTGSGFVTGPSAILQESRGVQTYPPQRSGANTVIFGSRRISNVISPDGVTMQFSVPFGGGCEGVTYSYACDPYLLPPGSYPVSVTNANGTSNSVSFTVTSGNTSPSIHVLSPNGGETWTTGTTQTITWRDTTPYPACPTGAQCAPAAPKNYDIKLFRDYPPCPAGQGCPAIAYAPYTIAKNMYGSSYDWPVGKVLETFGLGDTAPDGSYTVQVCEVGTSICDSSDRYFKIVSDGTIQRGWLSIEPADASLNVGETMQAKALYQPPMPPCEGVGVACIQVMPPSYPIQATWTSSNPHVATVNYKNTCPPRAYCFVGPDYLTAMVSGVGVGTTKLKATFTSPSGAVLTAMTDVTVMNSTTTLPPLPIVGGLSIEPASLKLRVGEKASVESFIDDCPHPSGPSGATCFAPLRRVDSRWSSSNLAIAGIHCPRPITDTTSTQSNACRVAEVLGKAPGIIEITAMSDTTPFTARATIEVITP